MKTIVIDVDGVLLDIHSALEKRLQSQGFENFSMQRVLTYDFNKSLAEDLVPEWLRSTFVCGDFYLNCNRDKIFESFSDVSLFESAKFDLSAVSLIREVSSKARVVLNTSSYLKGILAFKEEYLSALFKGTSVKISAYLGEKSPVAEADIVVDDCIAELDKYLFVQKYLLSKPYNQKQYNVISSDICRVESEGSLSAMALARIFKYFI